MNRKLYIIIIAAAAVLLTALPVSAQKSKYPITRLDAQLEPVKNSQGQFTDLWVSMNLTFKLTGGRPEILLELGEEHIIDARVTDKDGKYLGGRKDMRESGRSSITFSIPYGYKEPFLNVTVEFVMLGALFGPIKENSIFIDWVENWGVPVENVTYSFMPPEGKSFESIETEPLQGEMRQLKDGGQYCFVKIPNGQTDPLVVTFAPGLIDNPDGRKMRQEDVLMRNMIIAMVVFLVLCFFVMFRFSTKVEGHGRDRIYKRLTHRFTRRW